MTAAPPTSVPPSEPHDIGSGPSRWLGLPVLVIVALALLAVPRALVHDFLPDAAPILTPLLAIVPALVWIAVAALWSWHPLRSLLAVGTVYGLALGLVRNLAWSTVFADGSPALGGTLAGVLPSGTEELLGRAAASFSSLATGLVTGAVCGLLAWGVQAIARRAGARMPLR